MRHNRFQSIFDALTDAIRALESQPGPLPAQKQELLRQMQEQIAAIEAAQLVARPPSFAEPYEQGRRAANRRYGSAW